MCRVATRQLAQDLFFYLRAHGFVSSGLHASVSRWFCGNSPSPGLGSASRLVAYHPHPGLGPRWLLANFGECRFLQCAVGRVYILGKITMAGKEGETLAQKSATATKLSGRAGKGAGLSPIACGRLRSLVLQLDRPEGDYPPIFGAPHSFPTL